MENNMQSQKQQVSSGIANVRFGVYNQPSNVGGKTVAEAREQFSRLWGIPKDAIAYKGKDKLDESYVIQPGDNIEFHRRAGEKG
jgi:hypothetical protein